MDRGHQNSGQPPENTCFPPEASTGQFKIPHLLRSIVQTADVRMRARLTKDWFFGKRRLMRQWCHDLAASEASVGEQSVRVNTGGLAEKVKSTFNGCYGHIIRMNAPDAT